MQGRDGQGGGPPMLQSAQGGQGGQLSKARGEGSAITAERGRAGRVARLGARQVLQVPHLQ
jgi:hypothetical protein